MKKKTLLFVLLTACLSTVFGQKQITVEDIWQKGTFRTKAIPGFNFLKDGKHYAANMGEAIARFDLTTGKQDGTIFDAKTPFDDYIFSDDETKKKICIILFK